MLIIIEIKLITLKQRNFSRNYCQSKIYLIGKKKRNRRKLKIFAVAIFTTGYNFFVSY